MEIELDFDKSLEENASLYFEQAKKAKRKLAGLEEAIERTRKAIASFKAAEVKPKLVKKSKAKWFHAFHWFRSSNGFLVLAGRDAKSNERLVKKHLREGDSFLHADVQGGSVCIIKSEGREVPETTFKEAAQFAAVFSKAWREMFSAIDVYAVGADQVSKKPPSKSFLSTGSFMVYGKRKWFRKTPLKLAVGIVDCNVMAGPPSAVKKHTACFIELRQGKCKASVVAKEILTALEPCSGCRLSLDEIIRAIPSENLDIVC